MSEDIDFKEAYKSEVKKNQALEILFEQKTYELYVLNEKLKQSQKTIIKSEKLASIGRLAAGIAHEINNPLSFVSSNVDLLLDVFELDLDSEEGRKEFDEFIEDLPELKDDILEGLERIRNIINNVNNYTRTKELERQAMNLNQAILSSLHLIKNRLIGKINLTTNLSKIPNIFGNLNEIKQVILNLLVNAADAMPGGGALTVNTYTDEVYHHIVIEVTDSGSGIDEEQQLSIFDPFFSTKEVGKGSGLGLYVCHEIITAHGGSIDVRSTLGEGSCFTIRLPMDMRTNR